MPDDVTSIQAINAAIEREGLSWRAGQTTLSSLPPEEQRARLGLIVDAAELQRMRAETQRLAAQERQTFGAAVGAPAAVDWRNNGGNFVTPIKDQGGCGSCVSF